MFGLLSKRRPPFPVSRFPLTVHRPHLKTTIQNRKNGVSGIIIGDLFPGGRYLPVPVRHRAVAIQGCGR